MISWLESMLADHVVKEMGLDAEEVRDVVKRLAAIDEQLALKVVKIGLAIVRYLARKL